VTVATPASRTPPGRTGTYSALSRTFRITSPSPEVAHAVDLVYGEMRIDGDASRHALEIEIRKSADGPPAAHEILFAGERVFEASRTGDLLHQLDNELTIALEHAVPQLYFVHAAALADAGRATLLVGDSGAGKSTTAYALAASGMDYLSDELAPIDPRTGDVHPYPRAICLKRDPPAPLTLPSCHLRTEWTLHVPAKSLASRVSTRPVPLGRVIFVRYSPEHSRAVLESISRGEAAVRFYKGALNQLAHPSLGLDDTLSLIQRAECFTLLAAGVEETVQAVRDRSHVSA
jgi:hypothetical protein